MRHHLTPPDSELEAAWQNLANRYNARIRWGRPLEPNEGAAWSYEGSERIDDTWWHIFVHTNHPKFGRVREMLPSTPDWEPVPTTQRMWPAIW